MDPNRRMFVRKIVVGEVSEDFARLSVGLVVHSQPPLFLHGASAGCQDLPE